MTTAKRGRRRGGGRGRGPAKAAVQHTSVPTGRAAYAETRKSLLRSRGPVCAYCARTFPALELTLDHVTPRKGQSAYDRHDNLVLACKTCNGAKADSSFLAWILRDRSRATHLFRYGQHLSAGILDTLRPMVSADVVRQAEYATAPGRERFGASDTAASAKDSPYLEDAPAASTARRGRGTRSGRAPRAKKSSR